MGSKRHVQGELKGVVPPKTKAQLRGEEYLAATDDCHDAAEKVRTRKEALIEQMKAEKITVVKCHNSTGDVRALELVESQKLVSTKIDPIEVTK